MKASPEVLSALKLGHRVRIEMKKGDGLEQGKQLVDAIQADCNFRLVYLQRLGDAPIVVVWRCESVREAMSEVDPHPPAC